LEHLCVYNVYLSMSVGDMYWG